MFINWAYIPDKAIKSASALWLYYILYNRIGNCLSKDRRFYEIILAYVITRNDNTFKHIIKKGISNGKLSANQIFSSIICGITHGKEINHHQLTYPQKKMLCHNVEYDANVKSYLSNRPEDLSPEDFIKIGKDIAHNLFIYIKNMLEAPDYTNQCVIDLVKDMPNYPPAYSSCSSQSYSPSYGPNYEGSYVRDTLGWSKNDIDTILDGDPDAYWNID